MQTSMSAWTGQNHSFISPPSQLGAGSSESRPTFLGDEFDTFGVSGPLKAARDHCRWAYRAGETPQSVMKSVDRPAHPLSTWGDAIRAVESATYSTKFTSIRNADKEYLACLGKTTT